jgi:hypothetical protein
MELFLWGTISLASRAPAEAVLIAVRLLPLKNQINLNIILKPIFSLKEIHSVCVRYKDQSVGAVNVNKLCLL